jgi:hypoxanthine-DNA glycosylase
MAEKRKKTGEYQRLEHEFPPVFHEDSRILILGSFPSVKSREQQFYYGHPQNRFWKVLAGLYQEAVPATLEEKRALLQHHQIALWDVIDSCEIIGSSDSSIRDVQVTDLSQILDVCPIRQIYTNGKTAGRLFEKYQKPSCHRESIVLPSTSPANAACSLEMLLEAWSCIRYGSLKDQ